MKKHLILYFDGVCYLCNSIVNLLLKIDKKRNLKFSPIQSDFAQKELQKAEINLDGINSIIVQKESEFYVKSDAVIIIIKELSWFWQIFLVIKIIPLKLRDEFYDFIANHRYRWFGKKGKCMIPSPDLRSRFVVD